MLPFVFICVKASKCLLENMLPDIYTCCVLRHSLATWPHHFEDIFCTTGQCPTVFVLHIDHIPRVTNNNKLPIPCEHSSHWPLVVGLTKDPQDSSSCTTLHMFTTDIITCNEIYQASPPCLHAESNQIHCRST